MSIVIIRHDDDERTRAVRVNALTTNIFKHVDAGADIMVKVEQYNPTRTGEQNDKMWVLLRKLTRLVTVPVMDIMAGRISQQYLNEVQMKEFMTAQFTMETAMETQQRPLMAIVGQGNLVMLGASTSEMKTKRMSQFIEFLTAKLAQAESDVAR